MLMGQSRHFTTKNGDITGVSWQYDVHGNVNVNVHVTANAHVM